jgi:hypothetical protein
MNLCIFIFLNKTTNGGSENNLVYSNARELIVQNRKKRYNTSQKVPIMKRKINTIRGSAQSGHHSFASISVPVAKDSV